MKILLYLLIPVAVVAVFAVANWVRNRQPSSLESGVDAFRREMSALSPEARPIHRRPRERDGEPPAPGPGGAGTRPPPRRTGGTDPSDRSR